LHYHISLYDIEFGGDFSYQGAVTIKFDVKNDQSWNDIVLNAYQLKLQSAKLKTDSTRESENITYDEKRQRVTLDFGEGINYSGEATLTIKFQGTINNVRGRLTT
jgi:aminopeptidase N